MRLSFPSGPVPSGNRLPPSSEKDSEGYSKYEVAWGSDTQAKDFSFFRFPPFLSISLIFLHSCLARVSHCLEWAGPGRSTLCRAQK